MITAKLLAILVMMVLALTISSPASAQRLPPHVFLGTAWLDGQPVPDVTTVTAWVG